MFVSGISSGHAAYNLVKSNQERIISAFEALPTYKREAQHYERAIKNVASVEDLLDDRRLLTVALSAFQLESEVNKKALIRQVITEDPTDPKSLAKRLADPRWQNFAKAFHSLAVDGGASIRTAEAVDAVLALYRTNEFEKAMGASNEAIREAMYFKRIAASLTSVNQVLGDRVAAKVVRDTLGLPLAFSALDVKQQRQMLKAKRFDPGQFKDPGFLDKFVDRFLMATDRRAAAADVAPAVQLLQQVASAGSFGRVNLLA